MISFSMITIMTDFMNIPAFGDSMHVNVIVESPRGSATKFKYDPKHNAFTYGRPLADSLTYPHDWGFVPSTLGEDGDPLDGMVLHNRPTFPGTIIACKILGVLQVEQKEGGSTLRNDRYVFRPVNDGDNNTLNATARLALEHFFEGAIIGTSKKLRFIGWRNARVALAGLRRGAVGFQNNKRKS
jgi:inorganic pyrophosphatase